MAFLRFNTYSGGNKITVILKNNELKILQKYTQRKISTYNRLYKRILKYSDRAQF